MALVRGYDLGPWFAAEPQVEMLGGHRMRIVVANDLHDIFLMGTYFHTCLSLGDINDRSVLANAYDANKQVVFMFANDDAGRRQVVARQLIAVSSDFQLLGYNCYVNSRYAERVKHQDILNAMGSYCGRLAAQCGLDLVNQGSPQEIGDHFWYDDGACEWPAAAQMAWAANSRENELSVPSTCSLSIG